MYFLLTFILNKGITLLMLHLNLRTLKRVERLTEGQTGRRQHRHVKKEGSLPVAETKGPSRSNRRWQNICEEDVREFMPVEIAIRPVYTYKNG